MQQLHAGPAKQYGTHHSAARYQMSAAAYSSATLAMLAPRSLQELGRYDLLTPAGLQLLKQMLWQWPDAQRRGKQHCHY